MGSLLLLFIVVPAVELMLLIEIGRHIGTLPTLGLIIFTGALGATLARHQGLAVLRQVRQETAAGRMPAAALLDGVLILLAGAVLMTPGILTDIFGFLCLIPACRRLLAGYLRRRFERAARNGKVRVSVSPSGPMKDVTPSATVSNREPPLEFDR
jgi:UPF0716 protein FxsA